MIRFHPPLSFLFVAALVAGCKDAATTKPAKPVEVVVTTPVTDRVTELVDRNVPHMRKPLNFKRLLQAIDAAVV